MRGGEGNIFRICFYRALSVSLDGQKPFLAQHGLYLGVPAPEGPVGLPGIDGGTARIDELAHLLRSLLVERATSFEEGVETI